MLSPSFYKLGKRNLGRSIGLETAKKIIINDFDDWASKVNLVAYGKGKGLFDEPDFAQFQWGYTAPSYIQPLYAEKEEQPGFVIADVFYGKRREIKKLLQLNQGMRIFGKRRQRKLCSFL